MNFILDRKDIESMVRTFYVELYKNPEMDRIFNQVIKLDLESHIPVLVEFWETTILGINVSGKTESADTMGVHLKLNELTRLKKEHFDTWLNAFHLAVQKHIKEPYQTQFIERSKTIALMIQAKINYINEKK